MFATSTRCPFLLPRPLCHWALRGCESRERSGHSKEHRTFQVCSCEVSLARAHLKEMCLRNQVDLFKFHTRKVVSRQVTASKINTAYDSPCVSITSTQNEHINACDGDETRRAHTLATPNRQRPRTFARSASSRRTITDPLMFLAKMRCGIGYASSGSKTKSVSRGSVGTWRRSSSCSPKRSTNPNVCRSFHSHAFRSGSLECCRLRNVSRCALAICITRSQTDKPKFGSVSSL